ncbi:hypothetical protein GCM10009433_02360 [Psychroflexus lacisalsi]|uniref:YD repeat-containing protein n=2 Tax=Psychroflexus lacisalsi TaxID=503928 RepID=A0ABN1K159_9FLAO
MLIEDTKYDNNEERKDHLSEKFEVKFDKNSNILKHIVYSKVLNKPFKITTYDDQNRILKVEIYKGNGNGEALIQYFRDGLKKPDSIKIFSLDMVERRKYINYFKNKLVIRRDLIENDILRFYRLYKYDSKNHLTKELNINTENGFGVKNKLGGNTTIKLNSNDSTLYNTKIIGDTIIKKRETYEGLLVTDKTYKDENLEFKIQEQTSRQSGLTFQTRAHYKWKDSIKIEHKYYKDDNAIKSYFQTYIYEDKIVSKWVDSRMMKNGESEKSDVIYIKTIYDKNENWINKTYFRNDLIKRKIGRKIEYYCQDSY